MEVAQSHVGKNSFGESRSSTTPPTDYQFTGQKQDENELMYYGARFYDKYLGTFVSADTLIPDPTDISSYQRYMYAAGDPIKYNDPTGHDPLDGTWQEDFREVHGRVPNDHDRRDRLFSLIHPGSGSNGTWTDADWTTYTSSKSDYWAGTKPWPGEGSANLGRFATHVDRLASFYEPTEKRQFVRAFGLYFGSIPYGHRLRSAWDMTKPNDNFNEFPPYFEGRDGWNPVLLDEDLNPSHHYAGLFYAGYMFGAPTGLAANWVRDGPISDYNQVDIYLGDGAARQGWALKRGKYSVHELGGIIWYSLGTQDHLAPLY